MRVFFVAQPLEAALGEYHETDLVLVDSPTGDDVALKPAVYSDAGNVFVFGGAGTSRRTRMWFMKREE
eukprot:1998820-Alexandrium_andersonii.AAC.1